MAELNQIGTVIMDRMVLDLTNEFADSPDGEVIGVAKMGRLQDDPEALVINITVHVGDPQAPEAWTDTIFARRDDALDRSQFEAVTWEVGGKQTMWWRRGAVLWEFFGTKTGDSEIDAQRKAGVIEARIQRAIDKSISIPGCLDDFGEMVINIGTVTSQKFEGGGPPNQYIWRGKILWQAFTARS